MDQASASPAASCAHNPAAPRTLPSWLPSEGQARTVVPSRDGSAPQSVPHSEPVHIVPRPSSPALCQSDAKGNLLPDYYSGATGIPGRFSEGLLLRRFHLGGRVGLGERHDAFGDVRSQRRDARGACLIVQEAVVTRLHEAFLPAPHTGLRLAGPAHDLIGANTVRAQ